LPNGFSILLHKIVSIAWIVNVESPRPPLQPFDGSGIPLQGLNLLWAKNLPSRFKADDWVAIRGWKPAGEKIGLLSTDWHVFRHTYRSLWDETRAPIGVQQESDAEQQCGHNHERLRQRDTKSQAEGQIKVRSNGDSATDAAVCSRLRIVELCGVR
jgi:hypothetical protein